MKNNSFAIEKKKDTWTEISTVFNSKFPENQITAKQASNKWPAHKKEAKAAAKQRHAIIATGNTQAVEEIGAEESKTVAILDKQTEPIAYGKDSDKMSQKQNPKSQIWRPRVFAASDGDLDGEIQISPKVSKTFECPKSVLVQLKQLEHEEVMANLRWEEERSKELHQLKMEIAKREEEKSKEKARKDEEYHAARMEPLKTMSSNPMNELDPMNPFTISMLCSF